MWGVTGNPCELGCIEAASAPPCNSVQLRGLPADCYIATICKLGICRWGKKTEGYRGTRRLMGGQGAGRFQGAEGQGCTQGERRSAVYQVRLQGGKDVYRGSCLRAARSGASRTGSVPAYQACH